MKMCSEMEKGVYLFCIANLSEYVKKVLLESNWTVGDLKKRPKDVGEYLKIRGEFGFDQKKADEEFATAMRFIEEREERHFCTILDEEYPWMLRSSRYAPFGLMYEGSLDADWERTLTVVGTRRPLRESRQAAYRFALECGLNGVSVASGLAYGLDQTVAMGCLDGGGKTLGVLGCGLGVDYPRNAGLLKKRIVENGGAVVSQFVPYMPGLGYNFPLRNFTLGLMSPAVVAFQAGEHSGVLNTVGHALANGRDVCVHCSAVSDNRMCCGTADLAFDGAPVIEGVGELFDDAVRKVKKVEYSPMLQARSDLFRHGECWYEKL